MQPIKTLLVDDEFSAIEGLRIRLAQFPAIEIIGEATSVDEALAFTNKCMPDLIFLDIEMPGQSGFELLKALQPETYPAIIFVTAYHQHAVRAFEVRAVDYLLKPIKMARLQEAVDRVEENIALKSSKATMLATREAMDTPTPSHKVMNDIYAAHTEGYYVENEKLVIQDGRSPIALVPFTDVFWVDAAGDYMCVHTRSDTYVIRARLKNLLNDTLPGEFVQIHKSTIVNLRHIQHLEALRNSEFNVQLANGKMLKASRTYSKELKAKILNKASPTCKRVD